MLRMFRYVAVLSILSLLVFEASSARAQEIPTTAAQSALNDITARVYKLIDTTIRSIEVGTKEFNKHIEDINALNPLKFTSMDSARLPETISQVMQFRKWLAAYRTEHDRQVAGLSDSLFVLKSLSPDLAHDPGCKAFEESFGADQKAFDAYLAVLDKVYSQVLDALLFVGHTHYKIDKQLQFARSKDAEQYRDLLKRIDETTLEQRKVRDESIKATAWANKKIAEFNRQRKSKLVHSQTN